MKSIIENVINRKDYDLNVVLTKIDTLFAEDKLSLEDKQELENKARENAKAVNSYGPLQEQLNDLAKHLKAVEEKVKEIEKTLKELNNNSAEDSDEEITDSAEEYPEFVQPKGAHNSYMTGDKITFNGKKYKSTMDNNVWSPVAYPQGWEEITENEEEKTVDEILSE